MDRRDSPIAVFDSGVGGVSVLRALVRELPAERFVYFGDTKNAPYGPRATAQIRALTLGNLRALDARFGFKAAVIACNTATSASIGELRAEYPDRPVIGIEPALKLAAERHPGQTVLVLATETTLREEKYAALSARMAGICRVVDLPCPELVEFVERGETDSPALDAFLRDRLAPWLDGEAGAVVLGCTHFPFAAPALRRVLAKGTELLDGSEGTARQTRRQLAAAGLLRGGDQKGSVEFLSSSDDPAATARMLALFEQADEEQDAGSANEVRSDGRSNVPEYGETGAMLTKGF